MQILTLKVNNFFRVGPLLPGKIHKIFIYISVRTGIKKGRVSLAFSQ